LTITAPDPAVPADALPAPLAAPLLALPLPLPVLALPLPLPAAPLLPLPAEPLLATLPPPPAPAPNVTPSVPQAESKSAAAKPAIHPGRKFRICVLHHVSAPFMTENPSAAAAVPARRDR
jgi:hypothetical protein